MNEPLNLDALDRYVKHMERQAYGTPPPVDAPTSEHILAAVLAEIGATRVIQAKIRKGLAYVFALLFPGLGPLFVGSYVAASVYAISYLACVYRSLSPAFGPHGSISWTWCAGAIGIWLLSVVHTAIKAGTED